MDNTTVSAGPNKERIQLLVDALRSNKYRQTTGSLANFVAAQRKVRYCCLGVASEIAKEHGADVCRTPINMSRGDKSYYYHSKDVEPSTYGMLGVLTKEVQDWYGFPSSDPNLLTGVDGYAHSTASNLNDGWYWNFREIADAFERTYLNDGAVTPNNDK